MKILIMEDEEPLRRIYSKFLAKAGYEVDSVSDGWDGFKEGVTAGYDLVVSDYMMPTWDGMVSMDGLVALDPHLKFLFVSGLADSEEIKVLENHPNVEEVLQKPVSGPALVEKVSSILAS